MKRQVVNLGLLTAILVAPALGMEILNDAELEEVDAQGPQIVFNNGNVNSPQHNNSNSLEMHGNAERYINGVSKENVASSAANSATNLMNVGSGANVTVTQYNDQCTGGGANNTVRRAQLEIKNDGDVNEEQHNNNASVLLTDNVQRNGKHFSLINGAVSAINRSTNMVTVSSAGQINGSQGSKQGSKNVIAPNDLDAPNPPPSTVSGMNREFYHYVENNGDLNADQKNNQASLQLTDNAQRNVQNFDLINIAASAGNLATNVASLNASGDVGTAGMPFSQGNVQAACNQIAAGTIDENFEGAQDIVNNGNISAGVDQDNNNFSVQLKDNAQGNASAGILANISSSAANTASNIAYVNAGGDVYLEQYNEMEAANWIQSDTPQSISGMGGTHNNNNSVQVINNALSNTSSVLLVNAASSAVNTSWNIASVVGHSVTIQQHNTQNAVNVVGAGTTAPTCPTCSP